MSHRKFYVYFLLDPRKPVKLNTEFLSFLWEPFYVGKGKGDRAFHHVKQATTWSNQKNSFKLSKIRKIIEFGYLPIVYIPFNNLSENDALLIEKEYIEKFGTINSGILTNVKKDNSYSSISINRTKHCKSNGLFGKRFKTIVFNGSMFQVPLSSTIGIEKPKYKRHDGGEENKKRVGKQNGMFGKTSASKGKRWVKFNDGSSKLLTLAEIESLTIPFQYGRSLIDSHKRRIIFKDEFISHYVLSDLSTIEENRQFQFGINWNDTKETFIKVKNNGISKTQS
jgi:hypothetical protein